MRVRIAVLTTIVFAGLLGTTFPAHATVSCALPKTSWVARAPKALGLDAVKLQDAFDFATTHSSESVLVIRHGCLAGASRLDALTGGVAMDGWSMTKSVTALLVGRAVTLHKLDIDKPIGPYFPEADARHALLTPRDLLTMSSGLRLTWLRDFNATPLMPDRVRDALSLEPVHAHGSYWEYEQSPVSLLAETVKRAVHSDVQTFARSQLFGPLGIAPGSWTWDRDRAGHTEGWAHLKLLPSDWARFGLFVLHHGIWNGRRLVDPGYMKQFATSSKANHAYGFLTWLNGRDS